MTHKEVIHQIKILRRYWNIEMEHQYTLMTRHTTAAPQATLRHEHAKANVEALDYVLALLDSSKPTGE